MKCIGVFAALLLTVLFVQCNDCSDIACFTPPPFFNFEILDKETNENLFENGTYSTDRLLIRTANNSPVSFEADTSSFIINGLGWETQTEDITVTHLGEHLFSFHADMERVSEECCSFTRVLEMQILDLEFEYISDRETYVLYKP